MKLSPPYKKVLAYLYKNNNGEYQEIETLLDVNKTYRHSLHYQKIIKDLIELGYIEKLGGSGGIDIIIVGYPQKKHRPYRPPQRIGTEEYKPLKARITAKGMDYSLSFIINESPYSIIRIGKMISTHSGIFIILIGLITLLITIFDKCK